MARQATQLDGDKEVVGVQEQIKCRISVVLVPSKPSASFAFAIKPDKKPNDGDCHSDRGQLGVGANHFRFGSDYARCRGGKAQS